MPGRSWAAAARAAAAVLMLTVPLACAVVSVRIAPPARIEVAGQQVTVQPVLGQDRSQLFDGALVTPEHAEIAGTQVGVDVDANWNRIVPSDKRTRRYLVNLWENPVPAADLIQQAARRQMLVWGVGGFLVGALAVAGVLGMLLWRRRALARYPPEIAELVAAHNRRLRRTLLVVGALTAVALDVLAVRIYLDRDHRSVVADSAFDGTALEGAEVHGLLADALPFLSVLGSRSAFYDDVSDHLEAAIQDDPALRSGDGEVTFVLAEDFEDVNGMARQVGYAAGLVDADFVALSGDLTFAGKAVETYLLDTVDFYADGRPVLLAPGLHDTDTIVEAAEARGWRVADGETRTVAGLRILAVPDPRISAVGDFGAGTVLRDPDVAVGTVVEATTRRACADEPDFVLLHDHLFGREIAAAGCQRIAVLDGRSYQFIGPQPVVSTTGITTEFTSGSAGGHVDTSPHPGVIEHPARFAVLYVERATGVTDYAVVTVRPDASVTITPRTSITQPYDPDGP